MQRRSYGEGSIYQRRADGRWCGSVQLDGKRKTVYGDTRREVAEKLQKLLQQVKANGRVSDAGKTTVEMLARDWLDGSAGRLRPTTTDAYRVILDKHVSPGIGQIRLSRLDPPVLARFYAKLGTTVSRRRVESVHGFLHKVLGDAVRWGLIPSNPADQVDAPHRDQAEHAMWTAEQMQGFVDTIHCGKAGMYGYLFGFLLSSGCRLGEAIGLRWGDIDWLGSIVRIERQITEVRGRPVELAPKTKAGVRSLTLPIWGLDILRQQKALVASMRLRAGADWSPSDRVFVMSTGGIPGRRTLRKSLKAISVRAGVPALSAHGLRHLHLSLLAMNGVPLKVAQVRAGHSSPTITMKVYQHVLGDADRHAAQVLDIAMAR